MGRLPPESRAGLSKAKFRNAGLRPVLRRLNAARKTVRIRAFLDSDALSDTPLADFPANLLEREQPSPLFFVLSRELLESPDDGLAAGVNLRVKSNRHLRPRAAGQAIE